MDGVRAMGLEIAYHRPPLPSGPSGRELEVARLVADGRTQLATCACERGQ